MSTIHPMPVFETDGVLDPSEPLPPLDTDDLLPRRGRPRGSQKEREVATGAFGYPLREARPSFRMRASELELIQRAARHEGESFSAWSREALVREARRVLGGAL